MAEITQAERIELVVKRFNLSELLDVPHENVELFIHHRIEMMAHQLTAELLVPTKVLHEGMKVAEYPIDWWNAIKARLGFKHKTRVHYLNEYLLFPKIGVPQWSKEAGYMHVHHWKMRAAVRWRPDDEIEP